MSKKTAVAIIKAEPKHGGWRPGAGRKKTDAPQLALAGGDVKTLTTRQWADVARRSTAMATVRSRDPLSSPFRLPSFPPQAMPPKKLRMAMDDNISWASTEWAGSILASVGVQGLAFLGYPFLSELAQRPEYRVISETIADDATRKGIDFEITGEKQREEKEQAEKDRQPAGGASPLTAPLTPGQPGRGFTDQDPQKRQDKIKSAGKMDKVKAIKDELIRLELRDCLYATSRNDGFFGRTHVYMNFGEDVDGAADAELKTDIGDGRDKASRSKVSKEHPLKFIKPIEPVWTYPLAYNAINPLRTDWYNPQTWYVMGREIHVSRLLPFIGHPVPDLLKPAYSFGGISLSQLAMPYVDIWLQTRNAVAALIKSFSVMVLKTDVQTILAPGGGGPEGLISRVAGFTGMRDNQGTFVVNNATEDFTNVSASLAGLHELQAQSQEHIASVVRIPLIKYTGLQPTGLNASSEGEVRAYYDVIAAYQNRFLRPHMTRIINFVQLSLFGEIDPEITFEFEPLLEMSEKEKADLQKSVAERDQLFVDGGAISTEEWRKVIIDDPELPFADLDPDDVPELKEEEEGGLIPPGAGKAEEAVIGDPGAGGPAPAAPAAAPAGGGAGGGGGRPVAAAAPAEDPAFQPRQKPSGADKAFEESQHRRAPDGEFDGPGAHSNAEARARLDRATAAAREHDAEHGHHHGGLKSIAGPLGYANTGNSDDEDLIEDAGFEESKHKRGQPENAGQFGPGGGGGAKPQRTVARKVGGSTGLLRSRTSSTARPGAAARPDSSKAFEKAVAQTVEKATPKQREEYEKHTAKVAEFFSSDEGGKKALAKSVTKFITKHAAAVTEFQITGAVLMPFVGDVMSSALDAVGLAGVPGVTLGATAVASYAATKLMEHFHLSLGGAKELLVSAVRESIDILGGVKEIAARVADLEKKSGGLIGDEAPAEDNDLLDSLILLLLALEDLGEEDDEPEGGEEGAHDQAVDATFNEAKHPRGQPENAGEFATTSGGGGEAGSGSKKKSKVDKGKVKADLKKWTPNSTEEALDLLSGYVAGAGIEAQDFERGLLGDVPANTVAVTRSYGGLTINSNPVGGSMTRTLNIPGKTADHGFLQLPRDQEGKGIGKKILRSQIDLYNKLGIENVNVHANIDVGGYAWAKYGFIPTLSTWNSLRTVLMDQLESGVPSVVTEAPEAGESTEPADWDELSSSQQTQAEDEYTDSNLRSEIEYAEDSWRDNDAADDARYAVANDDDRQWALDAVNEIIEERAKNKEPPLPFRPQEIVDALKVDFEPGNSGDRGIDIGFDDEKFPERDQDAGQKQLPGIPAVTPAERLNAEMRDEIQSRLIEAFKAAADEKLQRGDVEPPSYIEESARESIADAWGSMDDRDRYRWTRDNTSIIEGVRHREPTSRYSRVEIEMPVEARQGLLKLARSDDPRSIWGIADSAYGKKLLLGSDWFGTLRLTDKDTMTRFNSYVGKPEAAHV